MKKAKLLFMGVSVVAVLGAAFAFSAKKVYQNGNVYTIENAVGDCTILDTQLTSTNAAQFETVTGTTIPDGPCITNLKVTVTE